VRARLVIRIQTVDTTHPLAKRVNLEILTRLNRRSRPIGIQHLVALILGALRLTLRPLHFLTGYRTDLTLGLEKGVAIVVFKE
jgi:hypothetical protein